jgi:hypothetical protein
MDYLLCIILKCLNEKFSLLLLSLKHVIAWRLSMHINENELEKIVKGLSYISICNQYS